MTRLRLATVGVVTFLGLLVPSTGEACSCVVDTRVDLAQQIRLSFERAEVVFVGDVITADQFSGVLKVERVWKGPIGDAVRMQHASRSPDGGMVFNTCVYTFTAGARYLVFGDRGSDGAIRAAHCGHTAPFSSADQTIRTLDELLRAAGSRSQMRVTTPPDQLANVLLWRTHLQVDVARLSADLRAAVEQYLERAQAYQRQRPEPTGGPAALPVAADARYERRLVAVTDHPRAWMLAVDYVSRLRPCYEWEGGYDCPEHEARFARGYRAENPDSPFREYLPLLEAHRWLCSAEGYEREKRPEEALRSRSEYTRIIAIATKATDLLIRTAAEALAVRARCF